MTAMQTGRGKTAMRSQGFTLIEVVIVIILTGIIAAIVAVFLRRPVESYVDSVARAELTDTADLALRRIARDVRLALPNSVRISADGRFLELLLTKTGGRYLAEDDGASGNPLRFEPGANCVTKPADCKFDVVGVMPGTTPGTANQAIIAGDNIVVYNLGPDLAPADAYAGGNRATVAPGGVSGNTVTLTANPFSGQAPPMPSPNRRFQVVTTPVTYFCDTGAGTLRRYWNYAISSAQPVNAAQAPLSGAASALLARGVTACSFAYQNLANVHTALVGLSLSLAAPNSNSGTVTLFHQIHVDNTP
jgi:MSHA biogenesis protein MshO